MFAVPVRKGSHNVGNSASIFSQIQTIVAPAASFAVAGAPCAIKGYVLPRVTEVKFNAGAAVWNQKQTRSTAASVAQYVRQTRYVQVEVALLHRAVQMYYHLIQVVLMEITL